MKSLNTGPKSGTEGFLCLQKLQGFHCFVDKTFLPRETLGTPEPGYRQILTIIAQSGDMGVAQLVEEVETADELRRMMDELPNTFLPLASPGNAARSRTLTVDTVTANCSTRYLSEFYTDSPET
ncbi:hypothetical protein B0H16DRAFT_1733097 [Mycena metata]|uniref:Uncharacterized protein n=1 Tax=Mycena metata TaxID=1033252 RepID=A0AAD7HZP0_9AGAR|nr:hypothetical protein B0H16DRAFT_1733097 [Mycena metata]